MADIPNLEPHLKGVIEQVLSNAGSLARGQIAYQVLISRNIEVEIALKVSTAIEYFQTASLLFDDLPCMDDGATRRGAPCPHKLYGEGATILAALALINRSYALFREVLLAVDSERAIHASRVIEECLGVSGVMNGQALDIHFSPSESSRKDVITIAKQKTASLMRLALVVPSIIAGATPREIHSAERLSIFWGVGYQLVDDMLELFSNTALEGKTLGTDFRLDRPNFLRYETPDSALEYFQRIVALMEQTINRLVTESDSWRFLSELQNQLVARFPQNAGPNKIQNVPTYHPL